MTGAGQSSDLQPPDPSEAPLRSLLDFLLPSRCVSCGCPRRGLGGGGACAACWRAAPLLDPRSACPCCALPADGAPCARCRMGTPPIARALAFGLYAGTLARIVQAFKFRGFDILAPPASARMAALAREQGLAEQADALVPVPSTSRRNRQRGYDPAGLLAEETGRRLKLPVLPALRRTRETAPQSALPAAERLRNVAGAFAASARARGRSLLLVDDVATTGATAFEAARALESAGAARVGLLLLARTPEPEDFRFPEIA